MSQPKPRSSPMRFKLKIGDHRRRVRWLARRQWHPKFVLLRKVRVENEQITVPVLIIMEVIETRWSDQHNRQLWRIPG